MYYNQKRTARGPTEWELIVTEHYQNPQNRVPLGPFVAMEKHAVYIRL